MNLQQARHYLAQHNRSLIVDKKGEPFTYFIKSEFESETEEEVTTLLEAMRIIIEAAVLT